MTLRRGDIMIKDKTNREYRFTEDDRGIISPEVENMTDEELREEFKRITGYYPEEEVK